MPASHIYHFPAPFSDKSALEAAKQAAALFVRTRVTKDDLILVKGSRGVRMETFLEML